MVGMVVQGTSADETLTGGDGDDRIFGGGGDDLLQGGGGDDRFMIRLEDWSVDGPPWPFAITRPERHVVRYEGGEGLDTFVADGGVARLDIASRLDSVERIAWGEGRTTGLLQLTGPGTFDLAAFLAEVEAPGLTLVQAIWAGATLLGTEADDVLAVMSEATLGGTIHGGEGDDELRAYRAWTPDEADEGLSGLLDGGAGDDRFRVVGALAAPGSLTVRGGEGRDTLLGIEGLDLRLTLESVERIESSRGMGLSGAGLLDFHDFEEVRLRGSIRGGGADQTVLAGEGRDAIALQGGEDSIDGRGGRDALYGGSGDDVLEGGAGGDTLFGREGHDLLFGGDGNDLILGDDGDDRLEGGAGDDRLFGGPGIDAVYGGDGDDRVYVMTRMRGNEILDGGAGYDTLEVARYISTQGTGLNLAAEVTGFERIKLKRDGLKLLGEGAIDFRDYDVDKDVRAYGQGRGQTVHAGDGDDRLYGGRGADVLFGDGGDDFLQGDAGRDSLYGGAGRDQFGERNGLEWEKVDDLIDGGPGLDTLRTRIIFGGAELISVERLVVERDNVLYFLKAGTLDLGDVVERRGSDMILLDVKAAQSLTGTQLDDRIALLHEGDSVNGHLGDDTFYFFGLEEGWSGTVDGGAGADKIKNSVVAGGTYRSVETLAGERMTGRVTVQGSGALDLDLFERVQNVRRYIVTGEGVELSGRRADETFEIRSPDVTIEGDGGRDVYDFTLRPARLDGARWRIEDFGPGGDQMVFDDLDGRHGGWSIADAFTGRKHQLVFRDETLKGDVDGDRRADFVIELPDVEQLDGHLILG